MKIALFPGSFDPLTKGHEEIVKRALPLFDKIFVAIAINSNKNSFFSIEKREKWLIDCFRNEKKVEVLRYDGLTVDICKKLRVNYIIRGLRNSVDFQYEQDVAQINKQLSGIDTIFLFSSPQLSNISSSIVRDIYKNKGNYEQFIPDNCKK